MNWFGSNTGLGDYIHYRRSKYLEHGIYRNRGKSSDAYGEAQQAYNNVKQIMKKQWSSNNSANIADFLTGFLRTNNLSDFGINEAEQKDIADRLVEIFNKEFDKNVNLASLQVEQGQNMETATMTKYRISQQELTSEKQIREANKSTILSRKQELEAILNDLERLVRVGASQGLSKQQIKKIEEDKNRATLFLDIVQQELNKMEKNKTKRTTVLNKQGDITLIGSVLLALNQLNREYGIPTSSEQGKLGEMYTAAAAYAAGHKIDQITSKTIKESLVGGTAQGSSTKYKLGGFFDKDLGGKLGFSLTYDQDNGLYISKKSEDTVDISVKLDDDQNAFGTQNLKASIKNYGNIQTLKGVKAVSGVSLLGILQLSGTNFANHYMNRQALKIQNNIEKYDNVVKYNLAVRALSGLRYQGFENDSNGKLSQYFIVHSRVHNRFFVFATQDLLKYLSSGFGQFNTGFGEITGFPSFGFLEKANAFVGDKGKLNSIDATARITNVLAQTHAQKLTMSLNFNAATNFLT